MNIRIKQVFLHAATAAGFLVGSSVVGCSSNDNNGGNVQPPPGGSGTTAGTSAGGTGAGGTSAGGTSAGGTGGDMAMAGTGGAGKCPGNQIMQMGMCACPAYAPTYCDAITKCVSDMKDPDHCGTCDTACGAQSACAAGMCTPDPVTVAEVAGCGSLQVQLANSKLYVLSTMTGDLSSIDLPAAAGATPTAITTTGVGAASAFAVDATNAYIAAGMSVVKVPLAGGAPVTLVTEAAKIYDVAVAGGKVYYATGMNIMEADATATTTVTGTVSAPAIDMGEAQGVAVTANGLVYASNQAFNLEYQPFGDATGHVKVNASAAGLIFGHRSVQVDATNAYWVNSSLQTATLAAIEAGSVMAMSADPGTEVTVQSSTIASPIDTSPVIAYAIDSANKTAYIATMDGSLEKSAFDQGNMDAIWINRGLPAVTSLVVDASGVYVASECKILKSGL